ncbi:hypothetical protein PVAP13_5KG551807 [Panicum virgatum]|uniref:Uncharacterized protein n=1 Tax=Panicum virgatum TaxID=38727 RepID=A0A8T0SUW2_PANVG|nr:hypothetical protein PVAP13_5KG551807 [Panicum virgatum]
MTATKPFGKQVDRGDVFPWAEEENRRPERGGRGPGGMAERCKPETCSQQGSKKPVHAAESFLVQVRPFRVCVPPGSGSGSGSGMDSDARVAPGLDFVHRSPLPLDEF